MYTDAKYVKPPFFTEPNGIQVEIDGVVSFVPLNPENSDYQNIMKLVEDGELTIAPAEESE